MTNKQAADKLMNAITYIMVTKESTPSTVLAEDILGECRLSILSDKLWAKYMTNFYQTAYAQRIARGVQ